MHGIVLKGLKDFVIDTYDRETWHALQREAPVEETLYVPVTEYPDEHVLSLVETALDMTGLSSQELLEAFGAYIVPPLVETYGVHVDQDWTGLELIANAETYIHTALRAKQLSTYTPPQLRTQWLDNDRVEVVYTSGRGLCALVTGIVSGVGAYYDEPLDTTETDCIHDGAESCRFVVIDDGPVDAD